jgi:hypothetical protein
MVTPIPIGLLDIIRLIAVEVGGITSAAEELSGGLRI